MYVDAEKYEENGPKVINSFMDKLPSLISPFSPFSMNPLLSLQISHLEGLIDLLGLIVNTISGNEATYYSYSHMPFEFSFQNRKSLQYVLI